MDRQGLETVYKTDSSRLLTLRNNTEVLMTNQNNNCTFEGRPGQGLQMQDQIPESCFNDQENEPNPSDASSDIIQSQERSRNQSKSRIESISKVPESNFLQSDELRKPQGGWKNEVWQNGALRIMAYAIRFVMYLLLNSEKFKFTFMKKKWFNAINDRAAVFEYYEERFMIRGKKKLNYTQLFKMKIQKNWVFQQSSLLLQFALSKMLIVIDPTSTPKLIWDIILLVILTIQMVFVPLKICFLVEVELTVSKMLLIQLPLIMYCLEMVLNFMTGFYELGVLVIDQKLIAINYLKHSFVYDLISVTPQIISTLNEDSRIFEILLLIRLKRLISLANSLEEILHLRQNYQTYIDVMRLLVQFLFLSHIFGCLWHYIAYLEESQGYLLILNFDIRYYTNWLAAKDIVQEDWYVRYIYSIYWSSITFLTIGYGDVIPVSSIERIYVVIVAVCSQIVFAYTISSIGMIFSQLNESKKNQRHKMTLITKFINQRGVNKVLSNKVKKFFEYFIKIDHSSDNECLKLIDSLDQCLKIELNIDIYRKYLTNSKLLSSTFSIDFLDELCQFVKEKQFTPDEQIFNADQQINELYIILEGEIALVIEQNKEKHKSHQLSSVKKNEVLGEKYFLTGEKLPFSAKASSFVRVAVIDKLEFLQLLEKFPEELEKHSQAKNKVQLLERIKIQGCELCYQNHKVLKCPFVSYQPNIKLIIKRQNNIIQCRSYKERRMAKSHNSRSDRLGIQHRLVTYALENNLLQEESINDSVMKKMDLQCLENSKQMYRTQTDSSLNTLLKNNMNNNNFQSGKESSPHESCDVIVRQNSSNTQNPKLSFTGFGGTQMNTLKLIMLNKKQEKNDKLEKIELKVPDKIILQDMGEHSSDSDQGSPDKTKLTRQNSFTFGTSADFKTQLQFEYYQKIIINELDGFDKYQEYTFYYPQFNVDKVLDQMNERYRLKRLKSSKIRKQSRYLSSKPNLSLRKRRSGIVGEDFINEN